MNSLQIKRKRIAQRNALNRNRNSQSTTEETKDQFYQPYDSAKYTVIEDGREDSEVISSSSSLHTDQSIELEFDMIPKKQAEINALSSQLSHFKIGSRWFLIEENSPIFNLTGPLAPYQGDHHNCYFCQDPLKKGKSSSCQFCGFWFCPKCQTKERPFPRAQIDEEGKILRGRVCVLCDRRFLLRLSIAKQQIKVSQLSHDYKHVSSQVSKLQNELMDAHLLKNLQYALYEQQAKQNISVVKVIQKYN